MAPLVAQMVAPSVAPLVAQFVLVTVVFAVTVPGCVVRGVPAVAVLFAPLATATVDDFVVDAGDFTGLQALRPAPYPVVVAS